MFETRRGYVLLLVLLATFSVFAFVTATTSKFSSYQLWGSYASLGYALATVTLVGSLCLSRGRFSALAWVRFGAACSALGALIFPIVVLVSRNLAMPELAVIERSGDLLVGVGTPFLSVSELAARSELYDYNPYLPGMALFGVVANALHVDLRLLFGLSFVACMIAATWLSRTYVARKFIDKRLLASGVALLISAPVFALPLAVGGDDLAVLGLVCLGLALAVMGQSRCVLVSAAAIGFACSMKALAFPALAVAFVMVAARKGRRAAAEFAITTVAVLAVVVVPVMVVDFGAFVENAVKFPLGMAAVATTASDPLPGHLIATSFEHGKPVSLALMAVCAFAVAFSLLRHPPMNLQAGVNRLAFGMCLAFCAAPAVRWGYFIYPAGLLLWAQLVSFLDRHAERSRSHHWCGGVTG